MPTITVTPDTVVIALSTTEKVGALHGDLSIPRSAIIGAAVVDDSMGAVSGIRAPGYAMPGHAKVGTWRHHDGKDFIAVYAGRPAVELRLTGQPYERILVSVDDPAAVVAQLGSAARG
jgi:hypothetical protein